MGESPNLTFLLDTGSTQSLVDQRLADRIRLKPRAVEALGLGGILSWKVAEIPEIQFGPIRVRNSRALVGKLAEFSEFGENVDVIIGLNLLSQADFTIDYDAKKITFHAGRKQEIVSAATEPASKCVILEGFIQRHSIRLIVDTGFSGLLLYRERILKQIPALRVTGHPKAVLVGKAMKATQVSIPEVVLGSKNIDTPVLLVNSAPPDAFTDIDGIIGPNILKAHKLHFDLSRRTVEWD